MTENREAVRDWAIMLRSWCAAEGGPDVITVNWAEITLTVDAERARIGARVPGVEDQPVDLELDEERFAVAPHVL